MEQYVDYRQVVRPLSKYNDRGEDMTEAYEAAPPLPSWSLWTSKANLKERLA
jgi:hypothetical protein